MNADAFRHFYGYHFAENRAIWDRYLPGLSQEQFTQAAGYSHGSIQSQVVHLVSVDAIWFNELRGLEPPDGLTPADFEDRTKLRARWDEVEQMMREYLANLSDAMLFQKPVAEGEDKYLRVWQILLQVVNHGTDHRAQILRSINDLGIKTVSQDYIFYVYDHPL